MDTVINSVGHSPDGQGTLFIENRLGDPKGTPESLSRGTVRGSIQLLRFEL